ncbi:hypothetical protein E2C01_031682 [Portunus trituberculatus]|uniref:Uncharacterized protein n=1 Tax=Portunus trituberculatus TaxID=210409 RepID=A0A5B7EYB6_PORTR|nr:hypothetical protein [Portunus trituberculatus]
MILQVGNIFVRTLMELALYLSGGSSNRFDWSVDTVFHHLWHTPSHLLKNGDVSSTALPANPPQHCVCGLVTQEVLRYKHNGWWKPVEFQLSDHLPTFPSQQKGNDQKSGKCKSSLEVSCSKESESEAESLGQCTEDSLEACGNSSDEDVDSLEKTPHSLEEEIDSLEGKLESFDIEEYDSLEDILDRYARPRDDGEECKVPEAKLEEHLPVVSGMIGVHFSAEFAGIRRASLYTICSLTPWNGLRSEWSTGSSNDVAGLLLVMVKLSEWWQMSPCQATEIFALFFPFSHLASSSFVSGWSSSLIDDP